MVELELLECCERAVPLLHEPEPRVLALVGDGQAVVARARLTQERERDEGDAGDGETRGQDEGGKLHRYAGVYPGA